MNNVLHEEIQWRTILSPGFSTYGYFQGLDLSWSANNIIIALTEGQWFWREENRIT